MKAPVTIQSRHTEHCVYDDKCPTAHTVSDDAFLMVKL